MKKLAPFIFATLLSFGSAAAQFIVIDETVKIVYTQEIISGQTVTVATVVVSETDDTTGVTTVRRMVQKRIPDGSGGFSEVVTQETTVVTPLPAKPGFFKVDSTSTTITTPIDSGGGRGTPVEVMGSPMSTPEVALADLNLPESTEFYPSGGIDDSIIISPL